MKTFTTARVLVVIAIALFSWLLLGPVMAILLQQMTETIPESFKSQGEYVFIHIPYIFLFLAILLGSRLILKCSLGSFISGSCGHFRWNLFLKTGLVYILFMAAATPFASKGLYASGVNILQYLLSAIPVLILTPIQTLSEEVLFRVLPLRLVTKEKMPGTVIESLPLIVISGILFALPHIGNREVAEAETAILPILCYFLWGAGAMFISISSDGFETGPALISISVLTEKQIETYLWLFAIGIQSNIDLNSTCFWNYLFLPMENRILQISVHARKRKVRL